MNGMKQVIKARQYICMQSFIQYIYDTFFLYGTSSLYVD